jgi:hypothetical protein
MMVAMVATEATLEPVTAPKAAQVTVADMARPPGRKPIQRSMHSKSSLAMPV